MSYVNHRAVHRYDGSTAESWIDMHCGHCGSKVTASIIASAMNKSVKWILCPGCKKGSVQNQGTMHPVGKIFFEVEDLPQEVNVAFEEVKRCISCSAYVAAELICRKILMHVAVEKGAEEGKSFKSYIDYLEESEFITTGMRGWVDIIRTNGNSATHSLEAVSFERAESTFMFTGELLRVVYEFPAKAARYTP